jgi:FKBP-type peptidyl-prolyl cis-trans isomerase
MDRKDSSADAVSRVVRWAVLLFFAYALFTGSFHFPRNSPHAPQASGAVAATKTVPAKDRQKDCDFQSNPFGNFTSIASSLIPTALPVIRQQDLTSGTGEGAACGQHATLHYEYKLQSGSLVFSDFKDDPAQVIIGDDSLLRGAEVGMLGMKPGGTREIAFPPALGLERVKDVRTVRDLSKFALKPGDLRDAIIIAKVSLISLAPHVPDSSQPLRIIERKFNSGMRAMCGDTVRVRMTVWKLDGTKVFSTEDGGKPLVFTIGASEAPYGIEQSVLGMGEQGERTAIIPAAYTRPLLTHMQWYVQPRLLTQSTSWPDEMLLAEITLEHIGDEMPSLAIVPPEKPATVSKPSSNASASGTASDKDDDDDDDKPEPKP